MHALLMRGELSGNDRPVSAAGMRLGLAYQRGSSIRRGCCCDALEEPHVLCRHYRCTFV